MNDPKLKARNRASVIASAAQVCASGLVFFVLYRYLYDRIGVEKIGVWSLVLATTSVSRIGELGLSAGVVRFVAQALGRGDRNRAQQVVDTVALTLGGFMAVFLPALYPLCVLFVGKLIPHHYVSLAVSILPYALFSLWANIVSSVFSGALDGCMRIDLRCIATGASHLAYLLLVFVLTPRLGLQGVAISQLIQALFLLAVTWWILRRQLGARSMIPHRWNPQILREMMGYGLSFQAISIMNMLFDPVAKALLSKFGGLPALGFYEIANKLILQGRAIIVEASRVLVPSIASLQVVDADRARQIFVSSYRLTFYVAVVFYGLLGVGLSAISLIWLGHYEPVFVQFALLLNVGWFVNTLIAPAYFSNLGSGSLRTNLISHVIMGTVGPASGYLLGLLFGGFGVVLGTVIGLISGSLYLCIVHIQKSGFNWLHFIVPHGSAWSLAFAVALTLIAYRTGVWNHSLVPVIGVGIGCALPLLVVGWMNPLRGILTNAESR